MTVRVTCRLEEDWVRVEVTGTRDEERLAASISQVWREVARACDEHGVDRVLFVSMVKGGRFPTVDAFQAYSTLDESGLQRSWTIAAVHLDRDSYAQALFAETVATNRGFTGKVFDNEKDARDWLRARPLAAP